MSERTPGGKTPIEVFCQTAELGLKLGVRPGNKLTVQPIEACPPGFLETLREAKGWLLILLQWPFVMVHSRALEETIFFCEDEDTRVALVEAGAEPSCIYTREELCLLVEQHRREPITAAELLSIHAAKRGFNASIAE